MVLVNPQPPTSTTLLRAQVNKIYLAILGVPCLSRVYKGVGEYMGRTHLDDIEGALSASLIGMCNL